MAKPLNTKITFSTTLSKTDPEKHPVLIVGQVKHLNQLQYEDVKVKLAPRVPEEVFKKAVSSLQPSPTDRCALYLNLATIAALPVKCSRHNTPSRSHSLTSIVQSSIVGVDESIVIVCERNELYASACAVSRAFPCFSRKTSAEKRSTVSVEFIVIPTQDAKNDSEGMLSDLSVLQHTATSIRLTAQIVDTPCNEMNVDGFLKEMEQIADLLNITPIIIRGEQLRDCGIGGIYSVGKAATSPPALAVLSYKPAGATTTVAWVGKGIVYDTGGLSIKGKTAMPGMKRDCGGAAAILGAFYTAVKCGFTQNLHAVFCLAENSVGPNATRPDDIVIMYSGMSVEVNNTDAEGRLVLADGVVYAKRDLKANIIIDMATLTGAQGIATGKYHAAVLSNNGEWEELLMNAGRTSGDLVFPVPFCPEMHLSEFSSAIADMKNSVADRGNAQPSCAGLFIGSHLGFDFPGTWVHIDMASPVHSGERATGYGVALLVTLFGSYSSSPMLKCIGPTLETRDGAMQPHTYAKKLRVY